MNSLPRLLNANAYPGRGILIGRSTAGTHAVIAYFIMGRSDQQPQPRLREETADGIRTQRV